MRGLRWVGPAAFAAAAVLSMSAVGPAQVMAQSATPVAVAPTVAAQAGVVLEMDGPDGARQTFTIADLEKMPRLAYETTTPWHDGKVRFEGVPLGALFDRLGVRSSVVQVEALDGYVIDFPVDDAREKPVILAYKANGAYMAIRDKGPLFVIYDYDSDRKLQSEAYYARSVWQVRSIRAR